MAYRQLRHRSYEATLNGKPQIIKPDNPAKSGVRQPADRRLFCRSTPLRVLPPWNSQRRLSVTTRSAPSHATARGEEAGKASRSVRELRVCGSDPATCDPAQATVREPRPNQAVDPGTA